MRKILISLMLAGLLAMATVVPAFAAHPGGGGIADGSGARNDNGGGGGGGLNDETRGGSGSGP